jgi:glycosyltransferase involved in cell wall biosynthesis
MKVTIFQYRLFHYRVKLFELMREKCQARGVELVVVYGQPFGDEIKKRDTGTLSWATAVKNRYWPIKEKKDLCWQPSPQQARGSDLMVFMHENRLLANYWWLARRALGLGPKVAFWGHGRDFQSNAPGGLREKWKALSLKWPDWWFAYTTMTEKILLNAGFDPARITVLQNAIDNQSFLHDLSAVDNDRLDALRAQLGLREQDFVGLYCGSLYADKRLDLLFEACAAVQARQPAFHLVLAGDGALCGQVERFCRDHPWGHFMGVQYGVEKAALFRLARVSLCPGAVGLNILDAFVAGTPLITRVHAKHGPEIAFLQPGVNGFAVDGEQQAYATCLQSVIENPDLLQRTRSGALASAEEFTVENMAERFVAGLLACLSPSATPVGR